MSTWLYKYRKIVILSFNLLLILLVSTLGFCRFEENDDIVMCMIANGEYTGTPDSHLVFINALYGLLLVGLYSITPAIEWYTISFLFLHWVAMSVVVYCVVSDDKQSFYSRMALLMVFYVMWLMMLHYLQFTTTAALVAFAGCLLLLRDNWKMLVGGALLVLVASLVRFEMAGLSVLVFSPMFLVSYKRQWKRYFVLVIVGIDVLVCKSIDSCFYQASEWKYYKEYNQLRGGLHDNPNLWRINPGFDERITDEDLQLFQMFFIDPTVFTKDVLVEMHDEIVKVPFFFKRIKGSVRWVYHNCLFLFGIFLLYSILYFGNGKKTGWLLAYFIAFVGLCFYINIGGTLKGRVLIGMLLPFVAVSSYLMQSFDRDKYVYTAILCMIVSIWALNIKPLGSFRDKKLILEEQLSMIDKSNCSAVIAFGADFKIEAFSPFDISLDSYPQIIFSGWLTSIPFNADRLGSYVQLIDKDVAIFLSKTNVEFIELIEKSITYHHSVNVSHKIINASDRYMLVQFKSVES